MRDECTTRAGKRERRAEWHKLANKVGNEHERQSGCPGTRHRPSNWKPQGKIPDPDTMHEPSANQIGDHRKDKPERYDKERRDESPAYAITVAGE